MNFEGLVDALEERVEVSKGMIDVPAEVEAERTHLGVSELLDCELRLAQRTNIGCLDLMPFIGSMPMAEVVKEPVFRESRLRSLTKSLAYRIVSIVGTSTLTWVVTRDVAQTISITILIQVFLAVLYYASERIWNRINWGRTAETRS